MRAPRFSLTRRAVLAGAAALAAAGPVRAQDSAFRLRAADSGLPLEGGEIVVRAAMFNEAASGPILEIRRGQPFALAVENVLDIPFRFRTQGLRGAAVEGADEPIAPGETRAIRVTAPDAGTFAYRAVTENAARAILLSGPLVAMAEIPPIADRDINLALNALILPDPDPDPAKPLRRVGLVNGAADTAILTARPDEKIRLRIVNLAAEGMQALILPAGMRIFALDGQPCPPFAPAEGRLLLPPFGRADLVLEVGRNPADAIEIADELEPGRVILRVKVEGEAMPGRYLAPALPDNPLLPKAIPYANATRAEFRIGAAQPEPLSTKAGRPVVLTIVNGPQLYALLIGGHCARRLDNMDDGWKPWWHDTLLLHPDETARLAFLPKEPGRFALDIIPLEGESGPSQVWIEVSPSA